MVTLKEICTQNQDASNTEYIETDAILLITNDSQSVKENVKQALKKLDSTIDKILEKSRSQQFMLRLMNAIVVTAYVACIGVALLPYDNYLD